MLVMLALSSSFRIYWGTEEELAVVSYGFGGGPGGLEYWFSPLVEETLLLLL